MKDCCNCRGGHCGATKDCATSGVYVVTSTLLGWDCVVAVFDEKSVSLDELENTYPEDSQYTITYCMVWKNLEDYK